MIAGQSIVPVPEVRNNEDQCMTHWAHVFEKVFAIHHPSQSGVKVCRTFKEKVKYNCVIGHYIRRTTPSQKWISTNVPLRYNPA